MNEWISVETRLPEDGVMVLVYEPSFARTDKHDERYGRYRRELGVRFGAYIASLSQIRPEGCNGEYNVTHWQPLPTPPQGDE